MRKKKPVISNRGLFFGFNSTVSCTYWWCVWVLYTCMMRVYMGYVCSTHIYRQYTYIYHPYTPSTYMYIALIYTINIHVYSTHIHYQYTCIAPIYTLLYNYCTWTRSIWGFMEQSTAILNEASPRSILLYSAP
jgi:hypothetical protein